MFYFSTIIPRRLTMELCSSIAQPFYPSPGGLANPHSGEEEVPTELEIGLKVNHDWNINFLPSNLLP